MSKLSVKIMPRFNAKRMVGEYGEKLSPCRPASSTPCRRQDNFLLSHAIAAWKSRVRKAWTGVSLRRLDIAPATITFGDALRFEVAVRLNGLDTKDVVVEWLLG